MQIRKAMTQAEQRSLLTGIVEIDEAYTGGKPRKGIWHEDDKPGKRGRGTNKAPIVGAVERDGRVTAKVTTKERMKERHMRSLVRERADTSKAGLITDEYSGTQIPLRPFNRTINHRSTTFNSTKRSPNNRKVHRACPAGGSGSLQAILTKRASPSPSSSTRERWCRSSATGKPPHTHRWRICSTSAFAFVRPQQHLGVTATIGGLPSSLHQPFQLLTFYAAQSHHITFLQG